MNDADGQGWLSKAWRHPVAALVGVLAIIGGGIGSGLGNRVVDWTFDLFDGDGQLLSYRAEDFRGECGMTTFLPAPSSERAKERPVPSNWKAFQSQPDAAYADIHLVLVSIQGESARKVTLTGIRFFVTHKKRPDGATFVANCGAPLEGRRVMVDVEAEPPRILASSKVPSGVPGSDASPIDFPWTVSVTDPLYLYVIATASKCYCVWKAEIPWVSGGKSGTIKIDNGGKGYTVVGVDGLAGYGTFNGEDWALIRKPRSPSS